MQKRTKTAVVAAALVAIFFALPAQAEVFESGTGNVELFLGAYDGEFPVYGVRGGAMLAADWFDQKWGVQASLARYTESETIMDVDYDLELLMLDLSLQWYFHSGDKFQWFAFAGPGWARVEVEIEGLGSFDDSEFTVHVGAGGKMSFTDSLYLRLDARTRDGGDGPEFGDIEATVGLGFTFGGN